MEKTQFKRLLFEVACGAIACDGHIDEREIRELQFIDQSTTYFADIDLSKQLDRFVADFKTNETEVIVRIIENIKAAILTPVEELLVLEIVLRLMYADVKIDDKEIEYILSIRSNLSISNEIIKDRFGAIDFLINNQQDVEELNEKPEEKGSFSSVDLKSLENRYYDLKDKKNK